MATDLRVAIAGFGTIGKVVGKALDDGIEGLVLTAVSARDKEKAAHNMSGFRHKAPVLDLVALSDQAEVIVDCVPRAAFLEAAEPTLKAGRLLLTVSGAGLLANPEVIELAKKHGGRIQLATGALLGLDAVKAAAEGRVESVTMITRKAPVSLVGAPHLIENQIRIDHLTEPLKVFDGSARDGAAGFPANVNVAAALGLAGIGPDRTRLEVWAVPGLKTNSHRIVVEAECARFEMSIDNVPSEENPATGRIVALSVIAALRGLVSPLRVGT